MKSGFNGIQTHNFVTSTKWLNLQTANHFLVTFFAAQLQRKFISKNFYLA